MAEPKSFRLTLMLSAALALVLGGRSPVVQGQEETKPKSLAIKSRYHVDKLYWLADGRNLVFGGNVTPGQPEWGAEIWSYFNNKSAVRLPGAEESPYFVPSPDGSTLVTVGAAEKSLEFRLWDIQKRELRKKVTVAYDGLLFQTRALAYSPEGTWLVCAGFSFSPPEAMKSDPHSNILIVDLRTETLHAQFTQDGETATAANFSPDGKMLITGHNVIDKDKPGIKVWHVERKALIKDWAAKRQTVFSVTVSPGGERAAGVGFSSPKNKDDTAFSGWEWDKFISILNIESGDLEHNLEGHGGSPSCVAFSPDGKLLATGGADKNVSIWDPESGKLLHTFSGHEASVRALAFSPDGDKLASGGLDKKVFIWDLGEVLAMRK